MVSSTIVPSTQWYKWEKVLIKAYYELRREWKKKKKNNVES